jgi:hypothetical protein
LKVTLPAVAVEQSGIPAVRLTDCPVQNVSDSGIVPVSTIAWAVEPATTPLSTAVVYASE